MEFLLLGFALGASAGILTTYGLLTQTARRRKRKQAQLPRPSILEQLKAQEQAPSTLLHTLRDTNPETFGRLAKPAPPEERRHVRAN